MNVRSVLQFVGSHYRFFIVLCGTGLFLHWLGPLKSGQQSSDKPPKIDEVLFCVENVLKASIIANEVPVRWNSFNTRIQTCVTPLTNLLDITVVNTSVHNLRYIHASEKNESCRVLAPDADDAQALIENLHCSVALKQNGTDGSYDMAVYTGIDSYSNLLTFSGVKAESLPCQLNVRLPGSNVSAKSLSLLARAQLMSRTQFTANDAWLFTSEDYMDKLIKPGCTD